MAGIQQFHFHTFQIRLIRHAILHHRLDTLDIDLQLLLEQSVLAYQLILQQATEIQLVHPVVQRVQLTLQLFPVGGRLGTGQSTGRTCAAAIPDRLVYLRHDLILILAQARDLKAGKKRGNLIAIERQLRHVALIACLTAYRELGKPSLAHITQAITLRLIDQTHLMNLWIIRPRPFVTLRDRDRFLSANPPGIPKQAN